MNLREALKDKVPAKYHQYLPRSFDVIGDIAIVQINEKLKRYKKVIAETILNLNKNIKVVGEKGKTEGIERIRKIKIIAGEKRSETIHKENGCLFKLDLNKVFYNERMQSERLRVAKEVKKGEVVFDLFAGVGPFAILIAKLKKVKVYAIDINKYAYKYLVENIKLNKVENYVIPFLGNCREVIEKNKFFNVADRVIMNLPKTSDEFLDVAFKVAKKNAIVHWYYFLKENNFKEGEKIIKEKASLYNKKVKILLVKKVGQIGKRTYRVVYDFKVS